MPVGNQLWFPVYPNSSPVVTPPTVPSGGTPIAAPTAIPQTYSPVYGGIPQVPSPTSTAGGAIGGNITNMADLLKMILGASGASAAGAQSQLQSNLPGYAPMTQQASTDILSNLQGQIPQDVKNQIIQSAAERGISVGAGSPNANAALLRAMGLTSLGLENTGQQQLTAAIGRTPVGPAQNPANYLVTPAQQQAAAEEQAILNAAPIPAQAAQARLNQLLAGLNAGRGAYGGGGGLPSPSSQSPTQDIINRYLGTVTGGGLPSPSGQGTFGGSYNYPDTSGMTPEAGQNWQDAQNAADQLGGTPEEWFNYLQGQAQPGEQAYAQPDQTAQDLFPGLTPESQPLPDYFASYTGGE